MTHKVTENIIQSLYSCCQYRVWLKVIVDENAKKQTDKFPGF